MLILDGKATAAETRASLKEEVASLLPRAGRAPGLAVILAGDDPASQVYVRNKEKAALEVGINARTLRLAATVSQKELEDVIAGLNAEDEVDGILLQLPLPRGLDADSCIARISPEKDVDGLTPHNQGLLALGRPGLQPCTPAGVMRLLDRYHISTSGRKAVVVGRSSLVGRPLALLLGVFSSALPYGLEIVALKQLPAQTFGILMSMEPVLAALSGIIFLGEQLNVAQWVALACIIVASIGATLTIRRKA